MSDHARPRPTATTTEVVAGAELTPGQVDRVTEAYEAAAQADGVNPLSEHVRLHLRHGGEGPDSHVLVRQDGVGPTGIVGYAHLDPTDAVAGPVAEMLIDPAFRRRGHGRTLLAAVIEAARRATGTDRLRLWAHGSHPGSGPLAAGFGFAEGRHLEQWRRSLDETLPAVALPDGVRLRGFRVGADEPAWLDLNARAFADHPEQGHWDVQDLQARLAEPWFDPEGFLLAQEDGVLVGFHWTKVHGASEHPDGDRQVPAGPDGIPHGHEPIGEVYVVGVDPAHQGRGLGRALTLAGLHRMGGLGLHRAMLYVEGDNTAAQATYRGLGFEHWDTDVMFFRGRAAVVV